MCLSCTRQLKITSVQTTDQFTPDNVDFKKEIPYHLEFEPEEVSHLVTAIKGTDDEVREKAKVLNINNNRLQRLITRLRNAISEHRDRENELICELAAAIDPASRHRAGPSLFHHQRGEKSTKVVEAEFDTESGPSTYTAIFSPKNKLFLINDQNQFEITVPLSMIPDLMAGANLKVIINSDTSTFSLTSEDKNSNTSNQFSMSASSMMNGNSRLFGILTLRESIAPLDRAKVIKIIYAAFGLHSAQELPYAINCYDMSLVDVILSIPKLRSNDASSLVVYLRQKNLLSAYIRAKFCQNWLGRTHDIEWPDLLGRWVALIDPKWVAKSAEYAERLDVMHVFARFDRLAPAAKYVIAVAVDIFSRSGRGDPVEFFWLLLFQFVLPDAGVTAQRSNALSKICASLPKKSQDSNTRVKTSEILKNLRKLRVEFSNVNEIQFLDNILMEHCVELTQILENIPFSGPEASPLFFPIVLELSEAQFVGDAPSLMVESVADSLGAAKGELFSDPNDAEEALNEKIQLLSSSSEDQKPQKLIQTPKKIQDLDENSEKSEPKSEKKVNSQKNDFNNECEEEILLLEEEEDQ